MQGAEGHRITWPNLLHRWRQVLLVGGPLVAGALIGVNIQDEVKGWYKVSTWICHGKPSRAIIDHRASA
jgi:hypothetical protein